MSSVKRNLRKKKAGGPEPGRAAQRSRTRRAIVEAAMRLMAAGETPSMQEIAAAAEVSRRTLYMYFPTLEQLLVDATLGALTRDTVDPVVAGAAPGNPVERVEQLSRAVNRHFAETIHLGRALIRLTVEGKTPAAGGPRRGYRRLEWIRQALEPARQQLGTAGFERLTAALCVLVGWEPMIVLKDICCLDQQQAEDVLAFAAGAVVEKALGAAQHTGKQPDEP
ncbi:MAG TPA: TetR/AcrR family transcriptional regulator [Terracidiphilus sp.]|nr:TetR/AcrR family transcriptional regulator [Terracidiphilus sp.]